MSYSIVTADLSRDQNEIIAIWERNYPNFLPLKYEWMYKNNPAGPPIVFLLRNDATKEYVGTATLFPKKICINGQHSLCAIAGDFLLDREHRAAGPALKLQKAVVNSIENKNIRLIYAYPNRASEAIQKRVGYEVLGTKVRLVKFLRPPSILSDKFFSKYWAKLISPILAVLLRFLSRENWIIPRKNLVYEEVERFDKKFDKLYSDQEKSFPIVTAKDSEYLQWRFKGSPVNKSKIFVLRNLQNDNLSGYIVATKNGTTMYIKDYFFPNSKKEMNQLVAHFVSNARKSGCHSIILALLENQIVNQQLKQFGFFKRITDHNIYIYSIEKNNDNYNLIHDKKNWLLLESDDDDISM